MEKVKTSINKQLYLSVKNGDVKQTKIHILNGESVNSCDEDGWSIMHIATWYGYLEIIKLLNYYGADVNISCNEGNTPLLLACQKGLLEIVIFLIEKGADVNCYNDLLWTPLYIAARNGKYDIVEHLLHYDVNLECKSDDGETPLWVAAYNSYTNIVSLLLNYGSNVNTVNNKGYSIVHNLTDKTIDMLNILLKFDVDINIKNKYNKTPLDILLYTPDENRVIINYLSELNGNL